MLANRGPGARPGARPAAPAGASGGIRRRPGGSASGKPAGILKYYTDEKPGLQISPVTVLVMSLSFIAFVTVLHAGAKVLSFSK